MTYQHVLPFDKDYAWTNLVKNLKRLEQGEKVVFYGFPDRKVVVRAITKGFYLLSSYSMTSLKHNIEQEGKLSFVEVEFMSTVQKQVNRHIHILEKSPTPNKDWRKQVYRCKDAQCTYYNTAQYVEGKEILCFKCKQPFVLDKKQLWKRNKRLVCLGCSKSPKKTVINAGKGVLDDIFNELELMEDEKFKEETQQEEITISDFQKKLDLD